VNQKEGLDKSPSFLYIITTMNVLDIGSIVKIIDSNRSSDIGSIGRIVFIKDQDIIIRTVGGNMLIKTNLNRVIRFDNR
jgi:RNase P/RNase MRP subunit p29